jgi:hypothetical protein
MRLRHLAVAWGQTVDKNPVGVDCGALEDGSVSERLKICNRASRNAKPDQQPRILSHPGQAIITMEHPN